MVFRISNIISIQVNFIFEFNYSLEHHLHSKLRVCQIRKEFFGRWKASKPMRKHFNVTYFQSFDVIFLKSIIKIIPPNSAKVLEIIKKI